MGTFNFQTCKSKNPLVVVMDKEKGAVVLASYQDGDNTVMLLVPADILNKLYAVSMPSVDLNLTSVTASFSPDAGVSLG